MNNFDEFSALISRWQDAYACAVYSYVGVKMPNANRLLCGKIRFELNQPVMNEEAFTFETEHYIAGRSVKKITANDVINAVAKAKVGRIDGFDEVVSLAAMDSRPYDEYLHPVAYPFISSLRISGVSRHQLLRAISFPPLDSELKVADVPFDTMDELLIYCGLPAFTQADQTFLELVAPSPGIIAADSIIENDEALIKIQTGNKLDVAKFRIGHRIFQKNQKMTRTSVKGEKLKWHEENNLMITTHRVPVGDAPVLEAYLSYDNIFLAQRLITNPKKQLNVRHEIYKISDPNLELLKEMLLKPEKDRSDKAETFERAISILLNLLGFSVASYGLIPKLQNGVDIIASTPSKDIAVIECTIGFLNQKDKLAKLARRTQLIKDKAGDDSIQVLPVIVTQLSRKEIEAHLAEAGNLGITVICREELENALNQIPLPPVPDQFFQGLKRLIPGSDSDSSFGNSIFR
jgi:hypothetical protein